MERLLNLRPLDAFGITFAKPCIGKRLVPNSCTPRARSAILEESKRMIEVEIEGFDDCFCERVKRRCIANFDVTIDAWLQRNTKMWMVVISELALFPFSYYCTEEGLPLRPMTNSEEISTVSDEPENHLVLKLAAQIVSAHVSHNPLPADALSPLISTVINALAGIGTEAKAAKSEPAVPISKSAFAGHIVCLECGKHFLTLKRHLRTEHDLTPEVYREKWGLNRSYPLVAADYAKRRSALAKELGLGTKRAADDVPQKAQPAKRGRRRKAA